MKQNRPYLVIGLVGVALFGALWMVRAQERPNWAPPPVLPAVAPTKYPLDPSTLPKKTKVADPAMIVPPEAYEAPRMIQPPTEWKPVVIVPAGGALPPPSFPPVMPAVMEKSALPPMPLPVPVVIESKAPAPLPVPEPTKMLINNAPPIEAPTQSPAPVPASALPAPVLPPANPPIVVAPPVTMPVVDPPMNDRPKSFVPIRPKPVEAPPLSPAPVVPPPYLAPDDSPVAKLVSLQTPSVIVEKRGPASLRAGETQLYQLVIRNVGTTGAQQIRIEDDVPADVRILTADPMPTMQGTRAIWTLTTLPAGCDQIVKLTLKADANVQLASSTTVHASAMSLTTRAAVAPVSNTQPALAIRVSGPEQIVVGKPAVFEVHVTNQSNQPLTSLVLHGELPPELVMPVRDNLGAMREERKIEGPIDGMTIAPGDFKVLKMPTTAVKAGRSTVLVKVATSQGEAASTINIDVSGEALLVKQAPTTRLVPGRDGDMRIEVANPTGKPMKNVTVASLLPEGISFVAANERGLYQSNSRTVYWYLEALPVGGTKTLLVRVNANKAGQYSSPVSVRADGVAEVRSTRTLVVEGSADLTLRVQDRDNPLQVGRETVYEIQVQNPGSAPASNVRVQVQFPPGLTPKNAQGNTKFSVDQQRVVFEPIASLGPQGQAIYRVSALAQTEGLDQRVRFSVVSDEVRTPLEREISMVVYSGK